MADTKISALVNGGVAQPLDLIPIARNGSNYSITPDAIQQFIWTEENIWAAPSTFNGPAVFSGSVSFTQPLNLGTPSSLVLTNATGLPIAGIAASGTPSVSTYLRGDGSWGPGSMTYPGAGIANSTGGAWGTSYTTSGNGSVLALTNSPVLVTPNLGTPSAAVLTNASGLPLATGVTGVLPVANGGSGTATPGLIAGTNVTISGTWPNQTINASGGGSMVYPAAGIPNSTGSAWGTSYTVSGSGTVLASTNSPVFTTPNLGTPSAAVLTNATGLPVAGLTGLGANVATALGQALNGSGAIAATTSPAFTTPNIGAASGASLSLSGAVSAAAHQATASAIITDATAARTLAAGDNGKTIYFTGSAAIAVTVPTGLGAGFSCLLVQGGTGQITVGAGAGATLRSYNSLVKTAGQYASATLLSPVADTYFLAGQLGS